MHIRPVFFGLTLLAIGSACGSSGDGGGKDATGNDGPAAVTVSVSYQGTSQAVALTGMPTIDVQGAPVVRLSDVVAKAFPAASLDKIQADFRSADGFMPASKDFCKTLIPLKGSLLAQGYIDPVTRNLSWDESLKYPGCMSVTGTAEILVTDS
jgi:hypothetical protein